MNIKDIQFAPDLQLPTGGLLVLAMGMNDSASAKALLGALRALRPDTRGIAGLSLKQALRHLREGGVLAASPWPGSPTMKDKAIGLRKGGQVAAWLARASGAAVLPLGFQKGTLHAGKLISAETILEYKTRDDLADYLRLRNWLLTQRAVQKQLRRPSPGLAHESAPLASPVDGSLLNDELNKLPPSQRLAVASELEVWTAEAAQIPLILREIGRLRELSFRAAGEGTGKPLDLDAFDRHYHQLFVYNRRSMEVVGGYRVGYADRLYRQGGPEAFYTHSLFNLSKELLQKVSGGLELGRSFVRPEYQRSFSPLMLLWKGIGALIARNPKYRYLFGVVSISNDYNPLSKELMVSYAKQHCFRPDLARLAAPRSPYAPGYLPRAVDEMSWRLGKDWDELNRWVVELEADGKGVPVLLKQYARLGGAFFGFNVDAAFGDVVDALVLVDLLKTDAKVLEKYLGAAGAMNLRDWHSGESLAGAPI